ncbi:hypothetical protein FRC12_009664 [Ceratobasidium sp. 428]|nr:hypothetical protein FRC09_020499 [Ceratobasidium sp. 395]KAG8791293.1 hypothetical protein FRC12_009664 [Ceratobasidium sp. 428]
MNRSNPVRMPLKGPIPNDSYIKTLVGQYDTQLFGEGGYKKFVADSACVIDVSELWSGPSGPLDKTSSSPDKAYERRKRPKGLVLASRGLSAGESALPTRKDSTPYPTALPNALAARSVLLYGSGVKGDTNRSTTENNSTLASEPRDSPDTRLLASPPSTDVSSTDPVSPSRPPKSTPGPRTGVLPSLPGSPMVNRCYVDLQRKPRTPSAPRTTIKAPGSEPTKGKGVERTKSRDRRLSY